MVEELEGTVTLLNGMAFRAATGSGHTVTLDAAAGAGGADRGPLPIELFLLGLGGCTGMDVISILRKMRQDVTGYEVRVRGERAEAHPRVYTKITVEHVVCGRNVSADAVERAVTLSATRYCPAASMLGKAVPIEETFRVVDEATAEETTGRVAAA